MVRIRVDDQKASIVLLLEIYGHCSSEDKGVLRGKERHWGGGCGNAAIHILVEVRPRRCRDRKRILRENFEILRRVHPCAGTREGLDLDLAGQRSGLALNLPRSLGWRLRWGSVRRTRCPRQNQRQKHGI